MARRPACLTFLNFFAMNSFRKLLNPYLIILVNNLPKSARTINKSGIPTQAYAMVAALPILVTGAMCPYPEKETNKLDEMKLKLEKERKKKWQEIERGEREEREKGREIIDGRHLSQ